MTHIPDRFSVKNNSTGRRATYTRTGDCWEVSIEDDGVTSRDVVSDTIAKSSYRYATSTWLDYEIETL